MRRLTRHRETHQVARLGWLRAAVLGANDGIVSTASLILGVAAAAASQQTILDRRHRRAGRRRHVDGRRRVRVRQRAIGHRDSRSRQGEARAGGRAAIRAGRAHAHLHGPRPGRRSWPARWPCNSWSTTRWAPMRATSWEFPRSPPHGPSGRVRVGRQLRDRRRVAPARGRPRATEPLVAGHSGRIADIPGAARRRFCENWWRKSAQGRRARCILGWARDGGHFRGGRTRRGGVLERDRPKGFLYGEEAVCGRAWSMRTYIDGRAAGCWAPAAADGGGGDERWRRGRSPTAAAVAAAPGPRASFSPHRISSNRCAAPRSGTDPFTTGLSGSHRSTPDQNNWLRSWTNELYLWYREVPDLNPSLYQTADYFDALKTCAKTPTGATRTVPFHLSHGGVGRAFDTGQEVTYGLTLGAHAADPTAAACVRRVSRAESARRHSERWHGARRRGAHGGWRGPREREHPGRRRHAECRLVPRQRGRKPHVRHSRFGGTTRTVTLRRREHHVDSGAERAHDQHADGARRLHAVQRSHRHGGGRADRCHHHAEEPRAITDLVLDIRYNGGGYLDIASRARVHDRRAHADGRADVRAAAVQRQVPEHESGDRRRR